MNSSRDRDRMAAPERGDGAYQQLLQALAGSGRDRIRVLFVLRTVPPYRLPFLSRLATFTPAIDLTIVTARAAGDPGKLLTVGDTRTFRLIRVGAKKLDIWKFTLIWIRLSRRLFDEIAPDILVLEGSFGILSHVPLALRARKTGCRVVLWVAGWSKPSMTGVAKWLREKYMSAALRLGDQFLCYSSAAASWLVRLGAPASAVRVAQNTIDVERIAADRDANAAAAVSIRARFGVHDAPTMVFVGSLTWEKRLDRLLGVHAALRSRGIAVHTIIVGDGPEALNIKAIAAGVPGIHLVGGVLDGVDAYFAAGDLFVLPGLGGLALNQAMANGLPVLCTDADGTEQDLVLEGITGHYRRHFDAQEWADLACAILLDPARRQRMGEAATLHVLHRASLAAMCDSFAASFVAALGDARRLPRRFNSSGVYGSE